MKNLQHPDTEPTTVETAVGMTWERWNSYGWKWTSSWQCAEISKQPLLRGEQWHAYVPKSPENHDHGMAVYNTLKTKIRGSRKIMPTGTANTESNVTAVCNYWHGQLRSGAGPREKENTRDGKVLSNVWRNINSLDCCIMVQQSSTESLLLYSAPCRAQKQNHWLQCARTVNSWRASGVEHPPPLLVPTEKSLNRKIYVPWAREILVVIGTIVARRLGKYVGVTRMCHGLLYQVLDRPRELCQASHRYVCWH